MVDPRGGGPTGIDHYGGAPLHGGFDPFDRQWRHGLMRTECGQRVPHGGCGGRETERGVADMGSRRCGPHTNRNAAGWRVIDLIHRKKRTGSQAGLFGMPPSEGGGGWLQPLAVKKAAGYKKAIENPPVQPQTVSEQVQARIFEGKKRTPYRNPKKTTGAYAAKQPVIHLSCIFLA